MLFSMVSYSRATTVTKTSPYQHTKSGISESVIQQGYASFLPTRSITWMIETAGLGMQNTCIKQLVSISHITFGVDLMFGSGDPRNMQHKLCISNLFARKSSRVPATAVSHMVLWSSTLGWSKMRLRILSRAEHALTDEGCTSVSD